LSALARLVFIIPLTFDLSFHKELRFQMTLRKQSLSRRKTSEAQGECALVIHGGAGPIPQIRFSRYQKGIANVLEKVVPVLLSGAKAIDVVEQAVRLMEEDEVFNASIGSTLRTDGSVVLDASIMDGATLACGAVGAVRGVLHPISLARAVMQRTKHVFLVGPGAEELARRCNLEILPMEKFITDIRREQWEKRLKGRYPGDASFGTVGAVCRDLKGRLASATSTGGMFYANAWRVGDTPIIGAGTYADNFSAVSTTGNGEAIMKVVLAKTCADLVANGVPPMSAARIAISILEEKVRGRAGLIVVSKTGDIGFAFNTKRMSWGCFTPKQGIYVPKSS